MAFSPEWLLKDEVKPEPAENLQCPVCGGTHFVYQFSALDRRVLNCAGCGLITLARRSGRPRRAPVLASLGKSAGPRQDNVDNRPTAKAVHELLVSLLGRTRVEAGMSPILLVGTDAHRYADGLRSLGLAVVDANAEAGADLAALRRRNCPDGFDICFCVGMLDRERHPGRILDSIHAVLRPEGAILFDLSFFVWTPSAYEAVSRQPRALEAHHHFSEETIASLLFRHGFGQVEARPLPGAADQHRLPTGPALVLARQRYADDPRTHRPKVSIVVPVYNEKATFLDVFEELHAKHIPWIDKEIIIVESNSRDGTRDDVLSVADRDGVVVVLEDRPRGKGHAVRAGLARATGDFILIQDADREYDIDDYDLLLEPLVRNRTPFVLGIRHSSGQGYWKVRHFSDAVVMSRVMNLGHLFFTALFNIVYGQRLRDPFTMFKVFRRDCITRLTFESNRFDFDWELMAKLVRSGFTPMEIPVNYESRSFAEGKKVSLLRDPITYFRACFKYRFVRL